MTKKLILSISAVLLIAAAAVGATYAYFTADISATNVVTIGNVNISATLAAETAPKQVTPGEPFGVRGLIVENKGNNPAYIRIQLRPVNAAEKGNYTSLQVVDTGNNLAVSQDDSGNWYHYKLKIDPKQTVTFTGLASLGENVKAASMASGVQLQYYVEAIQTERITLDSQGYPSWPNAEIKEYRGSAN